MWEVSRWTSESPKHRTQCTKCWEMGSCMMASMYMVCRWVLFCAVAFSDFAHTRTIQVWSLAWIELADLRLSCSGSTTDITLMKTLTLWCHKLFNLSLDNSLKDPAEIQYWTASCACYSVILSPPAAIPDIIWNATSERVQPCHCQMRCWAEPLPTYKWFRCTIWKI